MKSNLLNPESNLKAVVLAAIFAFAFNNFTVYAQSEIWGMTRDGGAYNYGVIFKTDASGNNYSVQQSFTRIEGSGPLYTDLLKASDGKFYGMTQSAGANAYGVLFQYDPVTNAYNKKFDFDGSAHGSYPDGSLMQANDGLLYGMTASGGVNNLGVLFKYDPVADTLIKLLDFQGTNTGSVPTGTLVQDTNGLLYGVTTTGGASNLGCLFSYNPAGGAFLKLKDFTGTANGQNPCGKLCKAFDGKYYGLTTLGGTSNLGTLYQYDLSANILTKMYDFIGGTQPAKPYGYLILAPDSNLYGFTESGGGLFTQYGTLFQFNPGTAVTTEKVSMSSTLGEYPYGSLVLANDGKLYGLTSTGTLLQYDYINNAARVKHTLISNIDGSNCKSSLIVADDGTLYGMTNQGGSNSEGVIFQYNPVDSAFNKKINFLGSDNGQAPWGSLVRASDGMLYGLTYSGGHNGHGVLFQLNPFTNTYTMKHDFIAGTDAQGAYGSLIQATNGKLYGMTYYGGTNNLGALFSYDPATDVYTKLFDFDGSAHGEQPYGSLMQASDGKLYGITSLGGAHSEGVIFQFDPLNNIFTKKIDFDPASTGWYSRSSMIQVGNGMLYFMTSQGGSANDGTISQYDPVNNILTTKVNFTGTNGSQPEGDLTLADDGDLYGVTSGGGINSHGVLFQYDYVNDVYTKKIDLDLTNTGGNSWCSLLNASNGLLYGLTSFGGSFDIGTLFEYNTSTNSFVKKLDFDTANGSAPQYTHLIEIYLINASTSVLANVSCHSGNNGTAAVTPTAGTPPFTYDWSPSGGTGQTASNLSAGSYTCTMTDSTGASVTEIVTITEPTALTANVSAYQNVSCFNGSDGWAAATASGGTGAFSYQWSPSGCTTQTCNNLSAGTYTVTVTDANGCTMTSNQTLTQPSAVTAFTVVGTNASCATCTDGSAFVIAGGGVPGYSYSWNTTPIQNTFSATGLSPGTYTACVTDANGCSTCSAVTITYPTSIDEVTFSSIRMYPNPAHNAITVSLNEEVKLQNTELKIFDVTGRVVLEQTINSKFSTVNFQLSAGVYFVKFSDGEKMYQQKLVVE